MLKMWKFCKTTLKIVWIEKRAWTGRVFFFFQNQVSLVSLVLWWYKKFRGETKLSTKNPLFDPTFYQENLAEIMLNNLENASIFQIFILPDFPTPGAPITKTLVSGLLLWVSNQPGTWCPKNKRKSKKIRRVS